MPLDARDGISPKGSKVTVKANLPYAPPETNVLAGICLALFIGSLALPIYFDIGSLRLAPYRIILILCFIPCFVVFLASDRTRWQWPDILIIAYALWAAITVFAAHGLAEGWEPAGILVVETLGSYFLARTLITRPSAFWVFSRIFVWFVMLLTPLAIYESLTSISPLIEFFGRFMNVHPNWDLEPRLGLHRAQVSFEHPILYGVFASTAFSLSYYSFSRKKNVFTALIRAIVVMAGVFCSLSVGAFLSIMAQLGYMIWEALTKHIRSRWYWLLAAAILIYVAIDMLSNRTPIEVIISYLTFQQDASYNRILIWNFGTAEVAKNPVLGLGLQDWDRPDWMGASVDNFWLLRAMRHGIPGFLFIAAMTICIAVKLIRNVQQDKTIDLCRQGILTSMIGLWISIITVDLWNASFSMLMFFSGSSVWLFEKRYSGIKSDQTLGFSSEIQPEPSDRAVPIIGGDRSRTAHRDKRAPWPEQWKDRSSRARK
jgi:hypothetical protein